MNPEGSFVSNTEEEEESPAFSEGTEPETAAMVSESDASEYVESSPESLVAAEDEISREALEEFEEDLFARNLNQINRSAQQAYRRMKSGIAINQDEVNAITNARKKWWHKRFGFTYSNEGKRIKLLRQMHLSSKQQAPTSIPSESRSTINEALRPEEERLPRAERYAAIARRMRMDLQHGQDQKGWLSYWKDRIAQDPLLFGGEREVSPKALGKLLKHESWIARRAEAMYALAKRLSDIDEREDYPEEEQIGRQTILFDPETETTYVEGSDGVRRAVSPDEIAIDLDWGNRYRPDESVPDRLWRKIRKRSDIAEARRAIGAIDNEELAQIEKLSLPTTAFTGEWIAEHFEKGGSSFAGIVAERMAKNVLKRRTLRDPELDFTVEDSNAMEDAMLKYDFSVVRRNRRGIATAPEGLSREEYVDEKRKLGVQFTTTARRNIVERKIHQIEEAKAVANSERMQKYTKSRVEDIVLVSLKLNASARYQRWLDEGKPPGGPERYMDDAEIEDLISRVTVGMPVSQDEEKEMDVTSAEESMDAQTSDDVLTSDEDAE